MELIKPQASNSEITPFLTRYGTGLWQQRGKELHVSIVGEPRMRSAPFFIPQFKLHHVLPDDVEVVELGVPEPKIEWEESKDSMNQTILTPIYCFVFELRGGLYA